MTHQNISDPLGSCPRIVRVLAPRTLPIVTDGTVSMILTDDYRLNPYLVCRGSAMAVGSITLPGIADPPSRYVMGTGLDPEQMWQDVPLQNGLRTMAAGWVLHFDCNPDLMLIMSVKEQNEYLSTRDRLSLPQLRWAADLKILAERDEQNA